MTACDRCGGTGVVCIAPSGDPDRAQDVPCPVCGTDAPEEQDADYARAEREYRTLDRGEL